MDMDYDAFIVGTGVAGSSMAYKLKNAGMKVAIADRVKYGGTCALHGCVPKKILSGVASIVDAENRMKDIGTHGTGELDWTALIDFKDSIVSSLTDSKEKGFVDAGIDTYHGTVSFEDENTLMVGSKKVSARHILLAVGARSRTIDIPGAEYLTTSDEFLDMKELPKKIIFAGGGYISFEFAHIAARAGSDVSIVHRGDNLLKKFDQDLVEMLVDASQKAGITIIRGQEIKGIDKRNGSLELTAFDRKQQKDMTYECDKVVHGLGRVPAIDELELEKGGVETEHDAIAVNEYLQSVSNPAVYAAGDCILPGPALTPTASLHANVVASNVINGNGQTADHTAIASAVFTIPTLASVGIMEKDATEEHRVIFTDMSQFYSTRRKNMGHAASKVIIEKDTYRIVGAHMIGANAEDTINIFALAVKAGLTTEQVRQVMYAYPAVSYDIKYMLK